MVKVQSSGFQENTNITTGHRTCRFLPHSPTEASAGLSSPLSIPLSHSLAVREGWAPAVGG